MNIDDKQPTDADSERPMTLIEKLEQERNGKARLAEYYKTVALEHLVHGLDTAIAIVKQHQGESVWVSVGERLPELGERVLTFTASGIETLYRSQYDNDLFIWERDCCQDYWTDEQVTHWMPLPQPPSEVQDD